MPEFVPSFTLPDDLDEFTRDYLTAAEWTDCNEDREEMAEATQFADSFIAKARDDCADFQRANASWLAKYQELTGYAGGTDFWLTRNRHGAGFWDRGNHAVFRLLTEAAHSHGSAELYAGDDGLVYEFGAENYTSKGG